MSGAVTTNTAWLAADDDWRCPVCDRTKHQAVRRTSTGSVQGKLVVHHDHFTDYASAQIMATFDAMAGGAAVEFLARARHVLAFLEAFSPVLICEDCNHAEARAKAAIGAPAEFSFGPLALRKARDLAHPMGVRPSLLPAAWENSLDWMNLEVRKRHLARFLREGRVSWREPSPFADDARDWQGLLDAIEERPGWKVPPALLLRRKGGR